MRQDQKGQTKERERTCMWNWGEGKGLRPRGDSEKETQKHKPKRGKEVMGLDWGPWGPKKTNDNQAASAELRGRKSWKGGGNPEKLEVSSTFRDGSHLEKGGGEV